MTGVDFPFTIDLRGRSRVVDRPAHVRALIEQVLFTSPGERLHRPTFGTGLHKMVFEPGGDEVASALQFVVQSALQQWMADEMDLRDVEVTASDATLTVVVRYVLHPDTEVRTDVFTQEVR